MLFGRKGEKRGFRNSDTLLGSCSERVEPRADGRFCQSYLRRYLPRYYLGCSHPSRISGSQVRAQISRNGFEPSKGEPSRASVLDDYQSTKLLRTNWFSTKPNYYYDPLQLLPEQGGTHTADLARRKEHSSRVRGWFRFSAVKSKTVKSDWMISNKF